LKKDEPTLTCNSSLSLGHYSCIPDASTGSGYPTVTSTSTAVITSTSTVTVVQTTTVTQFGTNTQIQVQTQDQTQTVVQTSITTTTLGAGQTVTVISVPVSAAPAESSMAASSSNSNSSSTPIGAIVGGAVGGLALLVIAGLFLFTGIRRGWFARRDSQPPVVSPPAPGTVGWKPEELPTTANQQPVHEVDGEPAPVEHYRQYRY